MKKAMNCFQQLRQDEAGVGVVEVAIILVIVIALALIFKTQIEGVLNTIIAKINAGIGGI